MSTLYEINDNIRALDTLLEELGGEVTDEQAEQAIDQWILENEIALEDKLDGYGMLIKNREAKAKLRKAKADTFKEEYERLNALAKTDSNIVTRLKDRLKWFFNDRGIVSKETDGFKFTVCANGGAQSMWFNEDFQSPELVTQLAPEYQRVITIPDMEKIKTDATRLQALDEQYRAALLEEPVQGQPVKIDVNAWTIENAHEHQTLCERLDGIAHMTPRGTHLRVK